MIIFLKNKNILSTAMVQVANCALDNTIHNTPYSLFTNCPNNIFYFLSSKIQIRITNRIQFHVFLVSNDLDCSFSLLCLSEKDFGRLRINGLVKFPLILFFWYFFMIKFKLCVFDRNITIWSMLYLSFSTWYFIIC